MLATGLGVDENDLEEVLESAAEVPDQLLLEPRPGAACACLDGGDVVLADAEAVCELSLCQAALLSHRSETNRPNF